MVVRKSEGRFKMSDIMSRGRHGKASEISGIILQTDRQTASHHSLLLINDCLLAEAERPPIIEGTVDQMFNTGG